MVGGRCAKRDNKNYSASDVGIVPVEFIAFWSDTHNFLLAGSTLLFWG